MRSNKKKWEKLDHCDCWKCREVVDNVRCEEHYEEKWEKKEDCTCFKCSDINIKVDCNNGQHDKKEKDDKKCDKCKGPTDKVEFKSDKSFLDDEIFGRPIPVLEVTFSKICENDKVWFSGIVGFDNDTDRPGDDVAVIKLTIVRSTEFGNERTIYRQTFEIDEPGHDDRTQVPFMHVEYEQNETKDVTYTVFVERLNDNRDVFLFGQNTLAALRIN